MGKSYFASDFHLGSPSYEASLEREKKVVRWLDQIATDAENLFLVGDIFDFWFEYRSTHQVENRDLHFAVETLPDNQQLDQFICQRDPRQVPQSGIRDFTTILTE